MQVDLQLLIESEVSHLPPAPPIPKVGCVLAVVHPCWQDDCGPHPDCHVSLPTPSPCTSTHLRWLCHASIREGTPSQELSLRHVRQRRGQRQSQRPMPNYLQFDCFSSKLTVHPLARVWQPLCVLLHHTRPHSPVWFLWQPNLGRSTRPQPADLDHLLPPHLPPRRGRHIGRQGRIGLILPPKNGCSNKANVVQY